MDFENSNVKLINDYPCSSINLCKIPIICKKIRRKYCNSEHAAPARSVTHCIALKNSATVTAAGRRSLTPDKSGRSRTSSATVAAKQRLAPELIPISLTRTIVLASGRVVFQVGNFKEAQTYASSTIIGSLLGFVTFVQDSSNQNATF